MFMSGSTSTSSRWVLWFFTLAITDVGCEAEQTQVKDAVTGGVMVRHQQAGLQPTTLPRAVYVTIRGL